MSVDKHKISILNKNLSNISTLKLPSLTESYIQMSMDTEEDDIKFIPILPFAISDLKQSSIKTVKLLTEGSDVKRVLELELISDFSDIQFHPGDTIGILPQNSDEDCNYIMDRLKLTNVDSKHNFLSIKKNKALPKHIPSKSTIRKIILNNLDFRGVLKKTFIRCLSEHTSNENEKRRLQELCSAEGSQDYTAAIESGITVLDILKIFPSCIPPFETILEHVPRLMPRAYSICSSPSDKTIKITFSVVNEKLIQGLCTNWLNNISRRKLSNCESIVDSLASLSINENDLIPFYFRKPTSFRLPENPNVPILMIGPGTGVAPFIGFLRHREHLKSSNNNLKFGKMCLIFGCRYSDKDFLYKNEIEHYLNSGILTRLFTAFSRENNNIKYVQDVIKTEYKYIYDMIEKESAIVFVCGDKKNMSKEVRLEISNCFKNIENISQDEALEKVNTMIKSCRYIEDVWI